MCAVNVFHCSPLLVRVHWCRIIASDNGGREGEGGESRRRC